MDFWVLVGAVVDVAGCWASEGEARKAARARIANRQVTQDAKIEERFLTPQTLFGMTWFCLLELRLHSLRKTSGKLIRKLTDCGVFTRILV